MLSLWILLFIIAGTSTGQPDYSSFPSDPSASQGRSYPQNIIVDLLMQTMAPNYSPNNPGDLFDILRDKYPLPNGKLHTTKLHFHAHKIIKTPKIYSLD